MMMTSEEEPDVRDVFQDAWQHLSLDRRVALYAADALVRRVALETAAAVAETLKASDLATRPVCAKKAEKDVLEQAARELQLLVLHTAATAHALDGQIPMTIESGRGPIGIEVKSGTNSISTDEVDKFRNDLVMGDFAVGVFASLRAPIAKMPRGLHVQREVSLRGSILAVYVSPVVGESAMLQLTRSALSLACTLAEQSHGRLGTPVPRFVAACNEEGVKQELVPVDWQRERAQDLAELGGMMKNEVSAIGIVRKRLRDEEESFHRRVERAADVLTGVQQRLATSAANLSLREPPGGSSSPSSS